LTICDNSVRHQTLPAFGGSGWGRGWMQTQLADVMTTPTSV